MSCRKTKWQESPALTCSVTSVFLGFGGKLSETAKTKASTSTQRQRRTAGTRNRSRRRRGRHISSNTSTDTCKDHHLHRKVPTLPRPATRADSTESPSLRESPSFLTDKRRDTCERRSTTKQSSSKFHRAAQTNSKKPRAPEHVKKRLGPSNRNRGCNGRSWPDVKNSFPATITDGWHPRGGWGDATPPAGALPMSASLYLLENDFASCDDFRILT